MKRFIFIPLLFFTLILSATDYYVKNGGNNAASGLDDDNAWETIAKVNSFAFSPGDSCFFNRGDTFTGTLTPSTSGSSTQYITFGAYGTGDLPIITPNAVVPGITWIVHAGDIWKTTDITGDPGNMLIDLEYKISSKERKKLMVLWANGLNIPDKFILRNKYGFVDAFREKDK